MMTIEGSDESAWAPAYAWRPREGRWRAASVGWLLTASVGAVSCGNPPLGGGDGGASRDAALEEQGPGLEAAAEHPVGCAVDAQCAAQAPYCVAGVCAPARPLGSGCASSSECASGHCTGGVCCGAASCPTCEACGNDGACAPSRGAPCTTPHASVSACDGAGTCATTECEPGYLDCDGDPGDGCETSFGLSNCGGCGKLCQPAHAVGAVCSETSGCGYAACAPFDGAGNLYLDCDGDVANGCESNPSSDATCGSCTTQCGLRSACGLGSTGAYTCVHQND
jgi:hypothetical protein